MEKLLQTKKGGTNASTINTRRTKKSLAVNGYDFFASAQQRLQLSTLFRMNYICQPIAGLLINSVN